jgi:putative NADH-flavin reductase
MPAPRRVLVLGATGPTGKLVVAGARERGLEVTALARRERDPAHPGVPFVAADLATDTTVLTSILPGHDVVICALGRGLALKSQGLMARATPAVLAGMERCGVRRLVFLSAFGVGPMPPGASMVLRFMFGVMLKDIYADKVIAEDLVRKSALDWTMLAPVALTNGPATGNYRLEEHLGVRGPTSMSRADVADAALRCVDDAATIRKRLEVGPRI